MTVHFQVPVGFALSSARATLATSATATVAITNPVVGRNNQETPIEDAKYKDGELSFKVTRERNGQKFTTMYEGKLRGDTIKGKAKSERDGKPQTRDWEAKRAKD